MAASTFRIRLVSRIHTGVQSQKACVDDIKIENSLQRGVRDEVVMTTD